ncbi:MAG: galactokinase [Acidimicrobiales bacterium]
MPPVRRARGPGRVNLIGDHTDYNHGVALPMAIALGVTVDYAPSAGRELLVRSTAFAPPAMLPLPVAPEAEAIGSLEPAWARPVAAMVALTRPPEGGTLEITADLPAGSGLSSSAALAVALAEVFGVDGSPRTIARLCQLAEHLAGAPVGPMDPLVCAGGLAGRALLVEFPSLDVRPVPVPSEADILVVDSGSPRSLRDSGYAARVAECRAAADRIGPLGLAAEEQLALLDDPRLRRRARHVVTECARVRRFAEALEDDDLSAAGTLMTASHRSLADDFEVSTPDLDALVERLSTMPGVLGARMTGAGFGGCVVALAHPGAVDPAALPTAAWRVSPVDGTVAARRRRQGRPDR